MYWFRIPSLPKAIYEKLAVLTAHFNVSQRQVVIAGVLALLRMGQENSGKSRELIEEVRKDYPEKARPQQP